MKRISPNWFFRMKAGLPFGAKVFGTVFVTGGGAILSYITASGLQVPLKYSMWNGIGSLLLGIVSAYVKGQLTHVPNIFIDEVGSEGEYKCEICDGKRLAEACVLTKPYYGNEYVPPEIAEQWRIKNPKAFVDILNSKGILCASFGILALKDNFMSLFINGKVSDTKLTEENICTLTESKKADRLYISGVVVRDAGTLLRGKRAKVMIWAMLMYVKKYYGLGRKRELYAVATNDLSNSILQTLNFKLVTERKNRCDKCNLYCYELTKSSWEALLDKVGDHSRLCTLEF